MRKRAIPFLLIGAVAWIIAWRLTDELMLAPFGYEMGRTFPAATYLRLLALLALLSFVVGLYLLATDLVRWIRG